jgi:hypothetical protein
VRGLKMHWILLFSQLPLDPGGTTEMRRLQSTTKRSDGRGSRSRKGRPGRKARAPARGERGSGSLLEEEEDVE